MDDSPYGITAANEVRTIFNTGSGGGGLIGARVTEGDAGTQTRVEEGDAGAVIRTTEGT